MKTRRRLTLRALVAFVIGAMIAPILIVAPAAATPQEDADALIAGLQQVGLGLVGLEGLDELAESIPLTELAPTGPGALDLGNTIASILSDVTSAAPTNPAEFETALESITSVGAVDVAIEVDVNTAPVRLTFTTFELTWDDPVDLTFATDDVNLDGLGLQSSLVATIANPSTAPFVVDIADTSLASIAAPAPAIGFAFAVNQNVDALADPTLRLGIADVTVTGDGSPAPEISAAVQLSASWLDPDGDGTITADELMLTAPLDLFNVEPASAPVEVDLTVSTSLIPGTEGSIQIADANALDGIDGVTISLGSIGDLNNLTPQDALAALAQVGVSLNALGIQLGNPDLPFLDEGLAQLMTLNQRFVEFFATEDLVADAAVGPFELEFSLEQLEVAGLDTIDGILDAFAERIAADSPEAINLRYVDGVLLFDLGFSVANGSPPAEVNLDFAQQLTITNDPADVPIAGLTLDNATVTVTPSFGINLTVGIDVAESPIFDDPSAPAGVNVTPIVDRVFLDTTSATPLIAANAQVDVSPANLRGQIGLLEVSLSEPDGFTLVGPSAPGTAMLEIDVNADDGRITLTELFGSLNDLSAADITTDLSGITIAKNGNTLTGLVNAGIGDGMQFDVDASVGGIDLTAGVDATVSVSMPNILDPASFDFTTTGFDELANFSTDDPVALVAMIITQLNAILQELDGVEGSALDTTIPVLGVSFSESLEWLDVIVDKLQLLIDDPAAGLDALELAIELAVFDGLQEAGIVTIDPADPIPTMPDPNVGTVEDYSAALEGYVADLELWLATNADFVDLGYDPTTDSLFVTLKFAEAWSDSTTVALDLAELGADLGGLVGASGQGAFDYQIGLDASLTLGLELDGATLPRPFLRDDSHFKLDIGGALMDGQFSANVGPFGVQIGDIDDDADDGLNGAPATAAFRGSLDLGFDVGGNGTADPVYFFDVAAGETGIGDWTAGVIGNISLTGPAVGGGDAAAYCTDTTTFPETAPALCATFPVYLDTAGTLSELGTIDLELSGLDPAGWTPPDLSALVAEIESNIEELALQLLVQGADELAALLEESLDAGAQDVDVPVIGDALDVGADIVGTFRTAVIAPVQAVVNAPGADSAALESQLEVALNDALDATGVNKGVDVTIGCTGGAATCSLTQIESVDVVLTLGQDGEAFSQPLNFDFGFPGLRLNTKDATLDANGSWNLGVGFGLSRSEGFYLLTEDTNLSVNANLDLNFGAAGVIQGDIAFIQIDVRDGKGDAPDPTTSEARLDFALDIVSPGGKLLLTNIGGFDIEPSITPTVDLDFDLNTKIDIAGLDGEALPKLYAEFRLYWAPGNLLDDPDVGEIVAGFDNVKLDLGSFIADFLQPILEDVQKFTKPIQPVIDTVSAPLPGVSDLAELIGEPPVTLLTLFESVSGNDLTLIRQVIDLITLVNSLGDLSVPTDATDDGICNTGLCIDIGSFDLAGGGLAGAPVPATQRGDALIASSTTTTDNVLTALNDSDLGGGSGGFKTALNKSKADVADADAPGLRFPAFQEPANLFSLLVGEDVDLVVWNAGELKASFGFSQSFGPIMIGPIPISITISGEAGIQGRFEIGYDTKGIRQLVENVTNDDPADDGFFTNVGAVLAGVFISDVDQAGNDVPEITFFAEIAAGAALDLVIVSAGIEGGIRATIDLNLHDGGYGDPDPADLDGKLRINEILSFISNPLCMFDVGGRLTAFLRAFVELDLFLVSKKWTFTIVNVTLLEFDDLFRDACTPSDPQPGEVVDGTLVLNIGPNAAARGFSTNLIDEQVLLRQLDGDSVSVTMFGLEETYHDVERIWANAGSGNDVIELEPGVDLANDNLEQVNAGDDIDNEIIEFTLPAILCGGSGDDRLLGANGPDVIYGDNPDDHIDRSSCGGVAGPGGNDQIAGRGADDDLFGGPGTDSISGDAGSDDLFGGSEDDELIGGEGPDTINGEDGNDVMLGGPESTPATDTMNGGAGDDFMDGDLGDDILDGGADDDQMLGGLGSDTMNGGPGNDAMVGDGEVDNGGNDNIAGNGGDDDIDGSSGDDLLYGDDRDSNASTGRDDITGGAGSDFMQGGPGEDVMIGDVGRINRNQIALAADPFESAVDGDGTLLPLVVLTTSDGGVDDMSGGPDADVMYGQEAGDTMAGDAGNDEMHGNNGDDAMTGGPGEDAMFGDAGADAMRGDGDDDNLRGGSDGDTIEGNGGADTIFGDSGADQIYGDAAIPGAADGADTIYGGPDGDTIEGNAAGDAINGDGGADTIYGDAATPGVLDGDDTISGGTEGDTIEGNAGADFINGDAGDDTIYGDAATPGTLDGADVISGGDDDDYIEGNAGGDTINGDGGIDRLIGGGDQPGEPDGSDIMSGGDAGDVMIGDNGTIGAAATAASMLVTLFIDGEGAGDDMAGDDGSDRMFGQQGNDIARGGAAADYIEGNAGDDDIRGESGDDDLIGGSSANDGVIDADRVGDGAADGGETAILGGAGADWIAGDNALISRVFPVPDRAAIELFDVETVATGPLGVGGADTIRGGVDNDAIFGQTGDDDISGGANDDYIEGNNGDDTIQGDDGQDDLIGGGSANDGVIDVDRVGDGLLDGGETLVAGGAGIDAIVGDNARILPDGVTSTSAGDVEGLTLGRVRSIVLFDVETVASGPGDSGVSGGDTLAGGPDDDMIFGQGNGAQSLSQADPADGLDNDLDGRESADSIEYDCADQFDNDGDGLIDGDEADCTSAIDEDAAWLGDTIDGDGGEDYIEGNAGADWLRGGVGDDDITGGGSANDGVIDTDRVGDGLLDRADVIQGGDDDDVVAGDNARISRTDVGGTWDRLDGYDFDVAVRSTTMAEAAEGRDAEGNGTAGNDWIDGDAGNDELYGQLGDDFVLGDIGDDGMVGDLGVMTLNVLGDGRDDPAINLAIDSGTPKVDDVTNPSGTLKWETTLFASDTENDVAAVGGADILLGWDGSDAAHGGPGRDIINGDGDATEELLDPTLEGVTYMTDVIADTADIDFLFGGDDDDVIWGGRDHDHLWGGHGDDFLDVRPREGGGTVGNGRDQRTVPRDPPLWFTFGGTENFHGEDIIYGGWGTDALQANIAENGPFDGDRLIDWVGAYNIYYSCPATYGSYVIIRAHSPAMIDFLETLSTGDGADDSATDGTSGHRELAMVFANQARFNANPAHPETPGHFTCFDTAGLVAGSGPTDGGAPTGGGNPGGGDPGGGGSDTLAAAAWAAEANWPADPITVSGVSYTRAQAIAIFDDSGNQDRSATLFAEVVAAKLNEAAGNDCVAGTISAAETWLDSNPPGSGVKNGNRVWRGEGSDLTATLSEFNEGGCTP